MAAITSSNKSVIRRERMGVADGAAQIENAYLDGGAVITNALLSSSLFQADIRIRRTANVIENNLTS